MILSGIACLAVSRRGLATHAMAALATGPLGHASCSAIVARGSARLPGAGQSPASHVTGLSSQYFSDFSDGAPQACPRLVRASRRIPPQSTGSSDLDFRRALSGAEAAHPEPIRSLARHGAPLGLRTSFIAASGTASRARPRHAPLRLSTGSSDRRLLAARGSPPRPCAMQAPALFSTGSSDHDSSRSCVRQRCAVLGASLHWASWPTSPFVRPYPGRGRPCPLTAPRLEASLSTGSFDHESCLGASRLSGVGQGNLRPSSARGLRTRFLLRHGRPGHACPRHALARNCTGSSDHHFSVARPYAVLFRAPHLGASSTTGSSDHEFHRARAGKVHAWQPHPRPGRPTIRPLHHWVFRPRMRTRLARHGWPILPTVRPRVPLGLPTRFHRHASQRHPGRSEATRAMASRRSPRGLRTSFPRKDSRATACCCDPWPSPSVPSTGPFWATVSRSRVAIRGLLRLAKPRRASASHWVCGPHFQVVRGVDTRPLPVPRSATLSLSSHGVFGPELSYRSRYAAPPYPARCALALRDALGLRTTILGTVHLAIADSGCVHHGVFRPHRFSRSCMAGRARPRPGGLAPAPPSHWAIWPRLFRIFRRPAMRTEAALRYAGSAAALLASSIHGAILAMISIPPAVSLRELDRRGVGRAKPASGGAFHWVCGPHLLRFCHANPRLGAPVAARMRGATHISARLPVQRLGQPTRRSPLGLRATILAPWLRWPSCRRPRRRSPGCGVPTHWAQRAARQDFPPSKRYADPRIATHRTGPLRPRFLDDAQGRATHAKLGPRIALGVHTD